MGICWPADKPDTASGFPIDHPAGPAEAQLKLSQHDRAKLMRNALAALRIGPTDRSLALRDLKQRALSEGQFSDHALTTLVRRIETDPKQALREIRAWSPPVGIDLAPAPPEWLRPAWRLATLFYWQKVIDDLVSNLSKDARPNAKPMRQSEIAEALREISRSVRAILNQVAHNEVTEFLEGEVAAEFLDNPEVLEHRDGSATVMFPPPKLRQSTAETRTSKCDSAVQSTEYFPAEQSLYALFPRALTCALEDLERLADRRADAPDLIDKGSSKTAAHLQRPPLKRGLAIKCIAMIQQATGKLPTPKELSPLIESIWGLAGLDDGEPESFDRPIKEALSLFRRKGGSRSDPDYWAISDATLQHYLTLLDPFTRS